MFVSSIWSADAARDFSRRMAIENAMPIINAIGVYQQANKKNPDKLEDLLPNQLPKIPHPMIMGIAHYDYENKNDDFSLSFTQNVLFFGFNFEVVIYSPKNQHQAKGELKTLYETGKANWKYYIYD